MIRRYGSIAAMLLMLGGMFLIAWWLNLEYQESQRQTDGVAAFHRASEAAVTRTGAEQPPENTNSTPAPPAETPKPEAAAPDEAAPEQTNAVVATDAEPHGSDEDGSGLADDWMQRNAAIDRADWSPKREQLWASLVQAPPLQPIALLDIDAVDLEVAVFPGATDENMDLGIGHITGTTRIPLKPDAVDTNIGLAGHRDGYFRNLQHIQTGHVITLQDLSGQMSRYTVTETRIVNPEDVSVLYPKGDHRITLVTCYPFYFVGHAPQRFIVSAVLEETPSASQDPAP